MNPIQWTDRCVRLACDRCGAHTLIEPRRYIAVVNRGDEVPCATCGGIELVRDRRRFDRPVERDRRSRLTAA